MSLFREYFYRKAPDQLVEISERVYTFDCCFSSDVMGEDEYKLYLSGIIAQLQNQYPDASFKAFNFRARDQKSRISTALSQYCMSTMDYPNEHESVPLLPLQMIDHFLKSSQSWLCQQNVVLMHCERGSLPLLDFMLSALLLYNKRYHGHQKALELVYNQANSMELIRLSSALNPQASQLRYLGYISTSYLGFDWPPASQAPLLLDCLVLRNLPHFEGRKVWRPRIRVFGQDPNAGANRSSILLFSTPKTSRVYQQNQEECLLVILDIKCRVRGDVVLECIHLHDALVGEDMVFRIMFHTAFVRGDSLIVQRDEMDMPWDAKEQFPKEFKAEVLFYDNSAVVPAIATAPPTRETVPPPPPPPPPPPMRRGAPPPPPPPPRPPCRCCGPPPPPPKPPLMHGGVSPTPPPPPPPLMHGGVPPTPPPPPPPLMHGGVPPTPPPPPPPFRYSGLRTPMSGLPYALHGEIEKISSLKPFYWVKLTRVVQGSIWFELGRHEEGQIESEFDISEIETLFSNLSRGRRNPVREKPRSLLLIHTREALNVEKFLIWGAKMPLPAMMAAILEMDESIVDADQIEKLIKACPTKEEMELLEHYCGEEANLGKCEQYFLEIMKVTRVESKLRVFSFKIQFGTQIKKFKKSLNAVKSTCEEIKSSKKLKEIFKRILYLGNTLNQGTSRGAAVGFKLDGLLKLHDTRDSNRKKTLMHYLCKVIASKASYLLDFHKDLESLESASKIQLNSMDSEMQAIIEGLEMLKQELTASETDVPVSDVFLKTLKDFISIAEAETEAVKSLYLDVIKDANTLAYYFGEDHKRCPFEQVTTTLVEFIRLFKKAHEENVKQAELTRCRSREVEDGERSRSH